MNGKEEADNLKNEQPVEQNGADDSASQVFDFNDILRSIAPRTEATDSLEILIPQDKLLMLISAASDAQKFRDQALRARADYANFQRRVARDAEETQEKRLREFFMSLVPVLEAFFLALEAQKTNSSDAVFEGIKLSFDQLLEVCKKFGLEKIDPSGKQLDVNYHEAVAKIPTADYPPMTVLHEVRPGFLFKGKTLRPSHVVVAVEPVESKQD